MSLIKKIFSKLKKRVDKRDNDPKVQYQRKNNEFTPVVLWWINQKKGGYDISTNKFPKWFLEKYGINFTEEVNYYINKGCLINKDNKIFLTDVGVNELAYYNCIVIMHKHPEYMLSFDDFKNNSNWHLISDNDIIWAIFNRRLLDFSKNKQWSSLEQNYLNMASLLIEEKKFKWALEFILPAAFLATSGLMDDNKLAPYKIDNGFIFVVNIEINNYYISNPIRQIIKAEKLSLDDIYQKYITSTFVQSLKTILPFYYLDIQSSWEILKYAIQAEKTKGIINMYDMKCQNIKLSYNLPNQNSNDYFYNSTENIVREYLKNK